MTEAAGLVLELEATAPLVVDAEPVTPPAPKRVLLSRRQLARALGRNLNTLNRWHDAGMPFVAAGIGGRGYEYDVDEVKAWRERVEREERERREAVEDEVQRHLALEGGSARDELIDLTLEQRGKHADNERRFLALNRERRDLVPAIEITTEFGEAFAYVSDRLQSLPDLLERRAQLSPAMVAVVLEVVDDLQDQMAQKLEEVDALLEPKGHHHRGGRHVDAA